MCFEGTNYVASKNIIQDLKRYDPNLESLLERAKRDDGEALFAGSLLLLGGFDLVPIDEVEVTEWTRRGALARHPACAVAYGLHLRTGYAVGRPRDADRYVVLGKKWLLEATKDQSQPCALMLRAAVEELGLGGFRRSKLIAKRFCAAAAELNDPFAQFKLAHDYEQQSRRNGTSDDQNAVTAFRLMRHSAEQGYAAAQRMLSIYLQSGFGTEKDPDASVTWLFRAADQHHPTAALEAGYWCSTQSKQAEPGSERANGLLEEMLNWYRVAARNGHPVAEAAIAYCYECGLGVEQNEAVAYSMYHALVHRDGRTFLTRLPSKPARDQISYRMAALKESAIVDREGGRLKMAWGEDEIIITETTNSTR